MLGTYIIGMRAAFCVALREDKCSLSYNSKAQTAVMHCAQKQYAAHCQTVLQLVEQANAVKPLCTCQLSCYR